MAGLSRHGYVGELSVITRREQLGPKPWQDHGSPTPPILLQQWAPLGLHKIVIRRYWGCIASAPPSRIPFHFVYSVSTRSDSRVPTRPASRVHSARLPVSTRPDATRFDQTLYARRPPFGRKKNHFPRDLAGPDPSQPLTPKPQTG